MSKEHRRLPDQYSVSILIPLYNEEEYIHTLLERVCDAPLPDGMAREIIVVDDCSTDGSAEAVQEFIVKRPENVRMVHHSKNMGKGAAIRTAIAYATGEFSLIQDADLEYDPREYEKLLAPLMCGEADVVYGSRFLHSGERRVLYFWHSLANKILTTICNIAADINLSDMETCYKAFRTSLLKSLPIRSNRFGLEPELTIKAARRRARIYEVAISYHGRTYEQGKKIGLKDAFEAIWVILKYRFSTDLYLDTGPEVLDALALAPKFNRWMADTIAPFVGQRVLEIGAGSGNLTRELAHRRKYYAATDIEPEHLERLRNDFRHRSNLEVRKCDVESAADLEPFRDRIDTVVFLNVLEHVNDDAGSLQRLHSVLQLGGRAIVLVPCGQEIFGTLDTALGHYRRYSRAQLRARMEEAGFHVERILEFNRVSRPGWYVTGRILKRATLSRLPMRCFNQLVWLWRRIDSHLPWDPTSIIAIGSKR